MLCFERILFLRLNTPNGLVKLGSQATNTTVSWQLADYSGKNAAQIKYGSPCDIYFEKIGVYQKLHILATAGGVDPSTPATMSVTVYYTDGTTSNQTFTVYDQCNENQLSISTNQFYRTNTARANAYSRLFDCVMAVNTTKLISHIKVANANNNSVVCNVMGVTGETAAIDVPTASKNNSTSNGFTVSWNAVADASKYCVDISTSDTFDTYCTFGDITYNNYPTTSTSVTVSSAQPNTTYYVRVRSVNSSGGQSASSDTIIVKIIVFTPIVGSIPVYAVVDKAYPSASNVTFKLTLLDSANLDQTTLFSANEMPMPSSDTLTFALPTKAGEAFRTGYGINDNDNPWKIVFDTPVCIITELVVPIQAAVTQLTKQKTCLLRLLRTKMTTLSL